MMSLVMKIAVLIREACILEQSQYLDEAIRLRQSCPVVSSILACEAFRTFKVRDHLLTGLMSPGDEDRSSALVVKNKSSACIRDVFLERRS